MCDVQAIFSYIYKHYPTDYVLDLDRLTKLVFLADWKASISLGKAITDVQWEIVNSEPQMDRSSLRKVVDFIGTRDKKISIGNIEITFLKVIKPNQRGIIDFVIEATKDKTDAELAQLVNSTFPALTQDETDAINLPKLAKHYSNDLRPKLRQENTDLHLHELKKTG